MVDTHAKADTVANTRRLHGGHMAYKVWRQGETQGGHMADKWQARLGRGHKRVWTRPKPNQGGHKADNGGHMADKHREHGQSK